MPPIAILRTLVVTLGLLLISLWQGIEARPGVQPQARAVDCGPTAGRPSGGGDLRSAGTDRLAPAVTGLVSSGDPLPDEACEPSRPRLGRTVERHEPSPAEPVHAIVGRLGADGLERPPKAGTRIPT